MKFASDQVEEAKKLEAKKLEAQKLEEARKLIAIHNKKENIKPTKSQYPTIMIGLFILGIFAPSFSLAILLVVGVIGWLIQQAD